MPDLDAGQDAVGVGLEAAAGEAGVDVLRHPAEVLVDGGVVRVGVGEPVVLVGGERELVARGAAEDEPGVVHRRRAVACEGQLEQARGQGVVEHREHAADQRRVEASVEEVDEQLGHVARRRHELVLVARPLQRAAQRERTARIEAHEVAGGDDADHGARRRRAPAGGCTPSVSMAMLASAARVSAPMVCTGADMMALTGASRETPPITTFSRRSTSVTMPSPSRARTRIGRAALGGHDLGGLADGRLGVAQRRRAAHHRGDRQRLHLRQRAQGARRVEQRVALGRRQPAHAVLTAEQLHAEVPGDAVERAVAACPHRERRRRAGEQAGVAEELAARHHGDQGLPAQEVQGAVAEDVELLRGRAALDDHGLARAHAAGASPRPPPARAGRRSASRTPRHGRGRPRSPRGSRPGCGGRQSCPHQACPTEYAHGFVPLAPRRSRTDGQHKRCRPLNPRRRRILTHCLRGEVHLGSPSIRRGGVRDGEMEVVPRVGPWSGSPPTSSCSDR